MKIARKEWRVNSTKQFYLEKCEWFRRMGRLFSPLLSEEDVFWILYFSNDCKKTKTSSYQFDAQQYKIVSKYIECIS